MLQAKPLIICRAALANIVCAGVSCYATLWCAQWREICCIRMDGIAQVGLRQLALHLCGLKAAIF